MTVSTQLRSLLAWRCRLSARTSESKLFQGSSLRRMARKTARQAVVYACVWAMTMSGMPLRAVTFYWDTDTSTAGNDIDGTGLGGSGAWDTSTSNWWNLSPLVPWGNANTDTAVFTGPYPLNGIPTANVVTLSSGIVANNLAFFRSGYTLTGGSLMLDGINPGMNVALGETAIINSQILGTAGFTKSGGGTVWLGNASNSYTGATTINNGIVAIRNAAALGSDPSAIVVNGSVTRGFAGGARCFWKVAIRPA